ncbi:MAG TPA: hypothetical protein VMS64_33595, partial [Candidatus Methylomirabilis sp.]|nr:hypothetical protein [Candidatus Methylomirabilis sp.]
MVRVNGTEPRVVPDAEQSRPRQSLVEERVQSPFFRFDHGQVASSRKSQSGRRTEARGRAPFALAAPVGGAALVVG